MSQLLITRTGPPAEVTELHPQTRPDPGLGEVLVRMQAAAVNPADLNFIEGTYGKKPDLPCVPGMEGAGVIEALGEGVAGLFPALIPGTPVRCASWSASELLACLRERSRWSSITGLAPASSRNDAPK